MAGSDRFAKLNAAQLKAVTTIDGPVLVVAGPGTGKTELLSARVANILQTTDTAPASILCLTYTEAGVIAMRQRLFQFIGSAAYAVGIYTYHAFCNEIIAENMEYFGRHDWQPITDVESIQLVEEIVRGFDAHHPLARVTDYNEVPRLRELYSIMKREGWSVDDIRQAVAAYLQELPFREEFIYQRKNGNFQKGDLKVKALEEEKQKMAKLLAAAESLSVYQEKLRLAGRYDYEDMISWVVAAFRQNDHLLARYQEKYLYILVDEFQDTNGAQYQILRSLTEFWGDQANVMVVGDDDQSIFRFQGASRQNIMDFMADYPKTLTRIVLTDNYRSTTPILEAAGGLIAHNEDRLEGDGEKQLRALAGKEPAVQPVVVEYFNTRHEEMDIVSQIIDLKKQAVDLSDVAIIYREHRQAANIIKMLEREGVPLNVKLSTNILTTVIVDQMVTLLTYLVGEIKEPFSQEALLFKILHYDFWGIKAHDVALLVHGLQQLSKDKKLPLRLAITDYPRILQLELAAPRELIAFGQLLSSWLEEFANEQFLPFFAKLLEEGKILERVLTSTDKLWNLQILSALSDFAKAEAAKNEYLTAADFLETIAAMQKYSVPLNINKLVSAPHGVNLITAHSAKGLEFTYVFLMGATAMVWDGSGNRQGYRFPDNLLPTARQNSDSDNRRLFYVAMTRAKQYLQISFAARNTEGKEQEKSRLIAELEESGTVDGRSVTLSEAVISAGEQKILLPVHLPEASLLSASQLDELLSNYRLSSTHLNKYLTCPLSFYFENILKVPTVRATTMTYGTCVHRALELTYQDYLNGESALEERVAQYFQREMQRVQAFFPRAEYRQRLEHGEDYLVRYVHQNGPQWSKQVVLEYPIRTAVYEGVPLSGKLDRLEMLGEQAVRVIDYKTGKYSSASRNGKFRPAQGDFMGGDYWRQVVFYKILLESDVYHKWRFASAVIDFVEPEGTEFSQAAIEVSPAEVALVAQQIKDTYAKILRHEFTTGCNDEDCEWCTFVRTHGGL